MKKNIFFLFCLCSFGIASAQFSGVGIKAGFTSYKFNDEITAKPGGGFHVGAFANYDFESSDIVFVKGGLLFTKKGSKLEKRSPGDWNTDDFDYLRNYHIRSWYLDVPILIGVKHSFSDDFFGYFNIGPSFNIGLFGDTDFEQIRIHSNATVFPDIKETYKTFDNLKRFDISACVALGASYKNFLLEVSYDYGFIPVMKNKDTEPKASNGCIMVSFGFMLPLNEGISGGF